MDVLDTPSRSLTELTITEYMALFGQAFGYVPDEHKLETGIEFGAPNLQITDGSRYLSIGRDGRMKAEQYNVKTNAMVAIPFNGVRLVQQLLKYGIDFPAPLTQQAVVTQDGELSWMRPINDVVGNPFSIRLLRSNLPTQGNHDALDYLLNIAWHWVSGDTLHKLENLADFWQKLHQELYFMEADRMPVSGIQVQWMTMNQCMAIASTDVPVTIYALIELTHKTQHQPDAVR